jgi:hypothetical protein
MPLMEREEIKRAHNARRSFTIRPPREADMQTICHEANKYCLHLHNARPDEFLMADRNGMCLGFVRLLDHGEYYEIEGPFARAGDDEREIIIELLRGIMKRVRDRKAYILSDLPETLESVGFEIAYEAPRDIAIKTGPT